ncbi:MAG TPA: SDR family oxidoreductase, partial [Bacteroidia bacterium]|nr:SDR family oxidoreductase [Bacteroidia bacterium]
FAAAVTQQFERLDVLVNNAGIFIPGTIEHEKDGAFERQIAVNVGGPYHLTRGLVQLLLDTPHSHLFNICSVASIKPVASAAAYTVSKYAAYGLTQLCREHFKNTQVKVTAILPGSTLTDSWSGTDIPENRFVRAHDVANAIWAAYNTSVGAVVEEIRIMPQEGEI